MVTTQVCSPQSTVSWLSIENLKQLPAHSSSALGQALSPGAARDVTPQWCLHSRDKRLSKALQAHCDQPWDQGEVLVIPSLRQHKKLLGR